MERPARPARPLPVHPLLIAAFPPLALYAANVGKFPISQLIRPLGLAVLGASCAWVVLALLMRHTRKSALAVSAAAGAFFSYGHFRNLLPAAAEPLIAPTCLAAAGAALYLLFRSRHPLVDATRVANLAAVILVFPSAWTVITCIGKTDAQFQTQREGAPREFQVDHYLAPEPKSASKSKGLDTGSLPDIYYIVLDAYGRDDRLRSIYGYDNSVFLTELNKRGFFVAKSSGANYDQTTLCLASALNMNYLRVPEEMMNADGTNRKPLPLREMIDKSRVAAFLKHKGYRYVSVWSGLDEVKLETPDVKFNAHAETSNFEDETRALTALEATDQSQRPRYDRHRQRILGGFSGLEDACREKGPKFVFAHILAPHPPFVLGENGESIYPRGPMSLADASWLLQAITKDEYKKSYIAQLKFVNRRILQAIDRVLARPGDPPIVIVQGDHGSRMGLDWESQAKSNLPEVFSILNAYHVPEKVRPKLYSSITPVNSFRVLLTELFGAPYPTLSDRSYYSTSGQPFVFSDITDLRPSLR